MAHDPRSLPHMLIDCGSPLPEVEEDSVVPVPDTAQEVVFVCTGFCFQCPAFLFALLDSSRLRAAAFPVIADDIFVPSLDVYDTIRAEGEQIIKDLPNYVEVEPGSGQIVRLAEQLFQTIAVVLRPHGSLMLLETQARELCARVSNVENRNKRILPRPHAKVAAVESSARLSGPRAAAANAEEPTLSVGAPPESAGCPHEDPVAEDVDAGVGDGDCLMEKAHSAPTARSMGVGAGGADAEQLLVQIREAQQHLQKLQQRFSAAGGVADAADQSAFVSFL